MIKIEWNKDALSDLKNIDKTIAQRIIKKISWIRDHFENIVPESLSGTLSGTYKYRIGD
ncbi:MAG: type II toxin-antitoxin system RelE/ParE family toxin [Nitrospirae bacterium]|nr:type II toxin-antitoxin system RelE/ParE family toxin [Nitrospirota bacterium]